MKKTRGPFASIDDAVAAIRDGRMIIVVDDEDRENEGDLTIAAESVTPDVINFMARHGRGQICLSMTGARLDGPQAAAVGLVDIFCEPESKLRDQLETLLTAIERCAPGANAETKRLFRACRTEAPDAYVATAARSFAAAVRGPEGREGVAAFLEKRPPSWARGP